MSARRLHRLTVIALDLCPGHSCDFSNYVTELLDYGSRLNFEITKDERIDLADGDTRILDDLLTAFDSPPPPPHVFPMVRHETQVSALSHDPAKGITFTEGAAVTKVSWSISVEYYDGPDRVRTPVGTYPTEPEAIAAARAWVARHLAPSEVDRSRAKRAYACPLCGAPAGRRCVNLTKYSHWWPGIPRTWETKHIHKERLDLLKPSPE